MKDKDIALIKSERLLKLFYQHAGKIKFNMGIVSPEDQETLKGPMIAAQAGIITPVLIGSVEKMKRAAELAGCDLRTCECIDIPDHLLAMQRAAAMAKAGELNGLMKGALHTDMFMQEVVNAKNELRTGRRMSHGMLIDVAHHPKLFIYADVAFNILPDLKSKKDIVQNAIDLARALGVATPKVALLSSVEAASEKVPSSIDCKELCKMAERGEIKGGIIEGPMQFDSAISLDIASTKKIPTQIAGDVDIFIMPNLDTGNIAVKQLEHFSGALTYGIGMGAKIPIVLVSRAATAESRIGSCMLANLYANFKNKEIS